MPEVRIAYVAHWNAFVLDGVARKLRTQVDTWRALGATVELFCLSPAAAGEPLLDARLYRYAGSRARVSQTARLARDVRSWSPEVVYLRQDVWAPPVWLLARRLPTVIELNEDDLAEMRHRRLRARLLNTVNRRALLGSAAGFVAVSRSIAETYAGFGKQTVVVPNSIDASFAPHLPPAANETPHAVFVGTPRVPWAGLDKLLDLARLLEDVHFDVVGWSERDVGEPLPPNVQAHGYLGRAEYEPVLARADVAIGTLALHRAGEDEGSPLKVREYLLTGLPVVIGYEDADLLGESPWWLLRIPNTEDNARSHAAEIREFVERVRGKRVPRDEVEPLIGPRAKEERRLAFLAEVVR